MENSLKFLPILISLQIFAILTTSVLARKATPKYRGGFGDSCSKTIKCKSESWLICNPETSQCGCAKPDEMAYDSERQKCVAIIGERCKYGFAFDDESLGSFYEKVDCVDGAKCESNDGICVCPNGTYEVVEKNKCLPVKPLGAVCQLSVECNDTLVCLNGKCGCATEDQVFELISGTCRIMAGKSCLSSNERNINDNFTDCINGSECMDGVCSCATGMYQNYGACLPQKGMGSSCLSSDECDDAQMLSCIDEKCVCRAGYSKTSKGLCGLGYNQPCSTENVCSDEFICTQCDTGVTTVIGNRIINLQDSRCLCPNTDLQFYDGNACKGVVGGHCENEIGCIKNAHCVFSDSNRHGTWYGEGNNICHCQQGFVEYDKMNCDVAYGSVCTPTNGIPCDRLSGLLCKQKPNESEFHCRCPDEHDVFSSEYRKCLRKRLSTCKRKEDCENRNCYFKHPSDSSGRCE